MYLMYLRMGYLIVFSISWWGFYQHHIPQCQDISLDDGFVLFFYSLKACFYFDQARIFWWIIIISKGIVRPIWIICIARAIVFFFGGRGRQVFRCIICGLFCLLIGAVMGRIIHCFFKKWDSSFIHFSYFITFV